MRHQTAAHTTQRKPMCRPR